MKERHVPVSLFFLVYLDDEDALRLLTTMESVYRAWCYKEWISTLLASNEYRLAALFC